MNSIYCKYCKQHDHRIDQCPTITCKKCHMRGHPTWHCQANGVQSKSNGVQSKSNDVQCKPNDVQCKSNDVQCKPNDVQCKPNGDSLWNYGDSLWNFISKRNKPWSNI